MELVEEKSCSSQACGVNNGSCNGGGCFGIKVRTDTAKLTNKVIAGFEDR